MTPDDQPDTRRRLLDAGQALFLAQGVDGTSLDQVRRRACASNGSLYHHFPSKAHLARALYLEALASYHAAVLPALAGSPAAVAGVRAIVERHVAWILRHPDRARVLAELRGATRIDGQWPDWSAVNRRAFDPLQAWIAVEVAAGRMLDMPLDAWLALVLAPAMQLTDGWLRQSRPAVPRRLRALLADAAARAVTPPEAGRPDAQAMTLPEPGRRHARG